MVVLVDADLLLVVGATASKKPGFVVSNCTG